MTKTKETDALMHKSSNILFGKRAISCLLRVQCASCAKIVYSYIVTRNVQAMILSV